MWSLRLLTLFLVLAVTQVAAAPSLQTLLDQSKQSMGGEAWDDVATLVMQYSVVSGGLEGTTTGIEDLLRGRYVTRYDLGILTGADGFDGEKVWSLDSNGAVIVSEALDEVEYARNTAFRTMRAFWFPERHPSEITRERHETLDGREYEVLLVKPEGSRPFELWIDSGTGYIARTVETLAIGKGTTIYSDYLDVDGLMIPHHVRSTEGEEKFDTVSVVTEVRVNQPMNDPVFNVPEEQLSKIEMAGDAITMPFQLVNNHIYIEALVNGVGPFNLLVDTGGANILVPRALERLELSGEGAIRGRGAGEESVEISLVKVDRITIGGMTMHDQTFYGVDLAEVERAEGYPIDGLVGFEVFKRFVVTIDYEHGRLKLTQPASFKYTGKAAPISFVFHGTTPQVSGSVDGFEGTFTLDTGSRSSLDIMAPFAERNKFSERYQPRLEAVTGWGVGGAVRSKVARAEQLSIGPVTVKDAVIELSVQSAGSTTDRYRAGNIGGGVLKRFTLTFDYENKLLWMEPNGWFNEPDRFDQSGMWINFANGGFEVFDVVNGGPAEKAGLEPGDLITKVDGRPASVWKLYNLRQSLRQREPDTDVLVTYRRGQDEFTTRLTLKELVP